MCLPMPHFTALIISSVLVQEAEVVGVYLGVS